MIFDGKITDEFQAAFNANRLYVKVDGHYELARVLTPSEVYYLKDENGNIDCKNCTNCHNCRGCVNCRQCYGCSNCQGCCDCNACVDSESLSNCFSCIKCTCCYMCGGCTDCHNSVYCSGCRDCKDCEQCTQVKEGEGTKHVDGF